MIRSGAAAATLAAILSLASPAAAQGTPSSLSPPDRQKAYVAVGKACRPETAQLCGDIDGRQLRNIAICLRPYMSNLSLGCRAALRTAAAPAKADGG